MVHQCAACKCELESEATENQQNTDPASDLPAGWYIRCIDSTDYVLCDVCGHQSHFCGGISPYLNDRLELMDGAQCDMSVEAAALGVQRRAGNRRRT